MALKDTWKETGKGLGFAFRDLGKAVIKTAKEGIDQADKWANQEDYPKPEGEAAQAEAAAENTAAEEASAEEKTAE